jgi:hypothetical protein
MVGESLISGILLVFVIGTFSLIMDSIYSKPEYYSPKLKHKESTKHQPEPTYRNDSVFTDEEYEY